MNQKAITVKYEGEAVGDFIAAILVENAIILELKSVRRLVRAHEVQPVNDLVANGKDVGRLLNFTEEKVEVKRKVRTLKKWINRMYDKILPILLSGQKFPLFT